MSKETIVWDWVTLKHSSAKQHRGTVTSSLTYDKIIEMNWDSQSSLPQEKFDD